MLEHVDWYLCGTAERPLLGPGPRGTVVRMARATLVTVGGETIEVAGLTLECVAIPGHSPAHVGYHVDGCLFSGDLLFAGSVARVDLPGADWDTLLASVRMLVDRYPPETVVYPGHGPVTTVDKERKYNPFF